MRIEQIEDSGDRRVEAFRNLPDGPPASGFIAETERVVRRVLRSRPDLIELVLVTPSHLERMRPVLSKLDDAVPVYVASRAVMTEVAGFKIHRGVFAAGRRPAPRTVDQLVDANTGDVATIVVADRVSDPRNLGALFRTGASFGIDGLVLGPGCADPLYRKTVRVSVGHALTVDWAPTESLPDALGLFRASGFRITGAELLEEARPARTLPGSGRLALVFGAEGDGLSSEVRDACDDFVQIEMEPDADSLNVTTAAAILLYERWVSVRETSGRTDGR